MVKQIVQEVIDEHVHKNTKANRFSNLFQPQDNNKRTWPSDGVVYIGHLPHGFFQEQLTTYFTQYGDVLGVKVARSKKTARSKGYAFVQFRYHQVANIVSQTMNGYLLLGKVLVAHTLQNNVKNPFSFTSSKKYKFINWKRIYIKRKNQVKTEEQTAHLIHNLLKKQEAKKAKLQQLGITYEYPGFGSFVEKKKSKK